MITTVGIGDATDEASVVVNMLASLRFPHLKADLVYVIENLGKADALMGMGATLGDLTGPRFVEMQNTWAQEAVDSALKIAKANAMSAASHILSGMVANRLTKFAQDTKADLLSLGSSDKGALEAMMIGSVGRKAVISSPTSVLLAKQEVDKSRGLRVVLATDHSEYANRCFENLLRLAPQGFDEIIVTTVYPPQLARTMMAASPHFKPDVNDLIEKELSRANQALIAKLAPLNALYSSRIEEGEVVETLSRVMVKEQADLLIMGAQGHGFLDRLAVGSVSLKMAMTEPKSVLLLRHRD